MRGELSQLDVTSGAMAIHARNLRSACVAVMELMREIVDTAEDGYHDRLGPLFARFQRASTDAFGAAQHLRAVCAALDPQVDPELALMADTRVAVAVEVAADVEAAIDIGLRMLRDEFG